MQANDLLTVGHFDAWARALLARVETPAAPGAGAPAEVVLYSKQRLAEVLDVDVDTVGRWLSKGKTGRNGQVVKLQAYRFTSEPRIPWPAVLAYERGEAFDLGSLPAPQPPPPRAAPVPTLPHPTRPNPDEPPLLRVA